jgi:hypothetical protein
MTACTRRPADLRDFLKATALFEQRLGFPCWRRCFLSFFVAGAMAFAEAAQRF